MQCAYCNRPITSKSAWKGTSDQFYCSEFCADYEGASLNPQVVVAEAVMIEPVAPVRRQHRAPTLLDYHLSRPYERLEKLLPYMRQISGRAAAAAQRESPTRAA